MNKEIIIVYQDCPTCGARKQWGEKTIAFATKAGLPVRKVSFVTREGEQLIWQAVEKGVTRLPFVTDGITFAYDVKSVLEAESKPQTDEKEKKSTTKQSGVAEKSKKTKKVKAKAQNESV